MTLRVILTNPVYIKADQLAYEYFTQQGMQIANPPEDFNGRHGILSYNKNIEKKGKSNKLRDVSEWILAIGNHKGIIDSIKWIQVQKLLEKNKDKAPRAGTSAAALLSGILRCGKCNSFIKVKYGQIKKGTDTRISYYVCNNKSISGGVRCDNTNVRTDVLESLVEEKLMEITSKQEYILSELEKEEKQGLLSYKSEQNNISVLKAQIEEINKKIDNLLNQLENEDKNSRASKRIKQRIEELEKEIENSNEKLKLATKNAEGINADNISLQLFKQSLINFSTLYNKTDDINLKRNLISSIVNQIRWYDGTVDIDIIGVKKN
jgi:site-specific DNA recombinase